MGVLLFAWHDVSVANSSLYEIGLTPFFVNEIKKHIPEDKDLSEIPAAQKRLPAKPLSYFQEVYRERDDAIVAAYRSGGYSMKDIGIHFCLHYSRISRIIKNYADRAKGKA